MQTSLILNPFASLTAAGGCSAFGLQGEIRSCSRYQNRVVLDGVDCFQLHQPSNIPVLQMLLEQRTRR